MSAIPGRSSRTRDVLIVEDDVSTRELLAAIVTRYDCRGVQCGDGRSAMVLLDGHPFDAVLLDLLLPELSGMELLDHVAVASSPQMLAHIVVITAAHDSVWAGCEPVGRVRALIRKPFDLGEVESALAACW